MLLFGLKRPPQAIFKFCGTTGLPTIRRWPHSFAAKPENQIDPVSVCGWVTNVLGNQLLMYGCPEVSVMVLFYFDGDVKSTCTIK